MKNYHHLTSEEVRKIAIELNNGMKYGYRENLSKLMNVSTHTIRSWLDKSTTESSRNCSGTAALLLLVLIDLHRKNQDVAALVKHQTML